MLNQINASYNDFVNGTATNDDYYGAWQQPWFSQADANIAEAGEYTGLSAAQLFWKGANYLFAGVFASLKRVSPEPLSKRYSFKLKL